MKKLILSYFFGLSLAFSLMAQEQQPSNFCGTAAGKTEWLKQYQNNREQYEKYRGKAMIYMPMTVTILSNDDGVAGYNVYNVLEHICQLNKDYELANIYFFLASPVRFIKNTKWNNHKTYGENEGLFDNNVENTINTYFCNQAAENCGYDYPGTGIVLNKGCMGTNSNTWSHEMGHELSLPHTFLGWEGETYKNNKPTPIEINGVPVEKVDGSNCKDAGDGFCDTPPDYLSYRWACGSDGKSPIELKDPNGVTFRADGSLFLAYPEDPCMKRFSAEQIAAMRANCQTQKQEFIAKSISVETIKDSTTLLSPATDAIINADSVSFAWTKVPNATNYCFEIAKDKKMFLNLVRINTIDTTTTVLLQRDKKYYWRVRPYNLSYTCAVELKEKVKYFSTELSSNVLDVKELEKISIYPNPIQSNGIVKIKINAKHTGTISLSLNDVTGRKISQQRVFLNEGENELDFSIGTLSSGLYLLQLSAPVGSVQRKITVF